MQGNAVSRASRAMEFMSFKLSAVCLVAALVCGNATAVDTDGDGQSDVWEILYAARSLSGILDTDGDGVSNMDEQRAGTDPFDPESFFALNSMPDGFSWFGFHGKTYRVLASSDTALNAWNVLADIPGGNEWAMVALPMDTNEHAVVRVDAQDQDADNDGLTDWEENIIGFDPRSRNTQNYSQNDYQRIASAINSTSYVSIAVIDGLIDESWPDPGVIALRRSGGIDPLAVTVTLSGAATVVEDYLMPTSLVVVFDAGRREGWIEFVPVDDGVSESNEEIVVTIQAASGFSVSGTPFASLTIVNANPGDGPSAKEASRFLLQSTFGPSADSVADVVSAGIENWIDDQLTLPPSYHRPMLDARTNAMLDTYQSHRISVWWKRVMEAEDQLRQRVAFALSEIFVVSELSALEGSPLALADYYDMLLDHAFANYYDLLLQVSLHPAMGIYLSHFQNQKGDPSANRFPDENYAREVMQLFSIGLWELNPDGSRIMTNGAPIPTYDNSDITELARVFTGLSLNGGDTNLWWEFVWPPVWDLFNPMQMWEMYHDTNTKVLVTGSVLPAGQPGMHDIRAAVSNLYIHPNVGPFIGTRLIQRLVTSNPSTGYVARVSAAFADNGSGVRGDMSAVIKAILTDSEARAASNMGAEAYGRLREPYLRLVNLARAFDASASNNEYNVWWIGDLFAQEPMASPSVFNFFQPDYQPPGEVKQAGLVAPEFQITTDVTSISVPNHMRYAIEYHLNWSTGAVDEVRLDIDPYLPLAGQPDELIQGLDLVLTGGTLRPQNHQIIREAVERYSSSLPTQRVNLAVYLLTTSPGFCIQK